MVKLQKINIRKCNSGDCQISCCHLFISWYQLPTYENLNYILCKLLLKARRQERNEEYLCLYYGYNEEKN